jgi:hypothetical protein
MQAFSRKGFAMQTLSSEALDDYLKWREVVFSVTRAQGEDVSDPSERVYGVIMDVGLSNNFVITVTAFATGESSLRTTVGGGAIGLGGDLFIAEQAKQIVTLAQLLRKNTRLTNHHDLPQGKRVYFYFLTSSGFMRIESTVEETYSQTHPFHEMFSRFTAIKARSEELLKGSRP